MIKRSFRIPAVSDRRIQVERGQWAQPPCQPLIKEIVAERLRQFQIADIRSIVYRNPKKSERLLGFLNGGCRVALALWSESE
jgi:hypothetical protein